MAGVDNIKWSDTLHSPRTLLEQYGERLPIYVIVEKGFCGQNDIETISTNQMARIDSVCEQRRVLILDMAGQYFSVPDDLNVKFVIRHRRKIKRKTLKEILKRYTLPVPVSTDSKLIWQPRIEKEKYTGNSWGQLLIVTEYTEKFFRINTITDGVINNAVSLLPVYVKIRLRVAEGTKASSRMNWKDLSEMYSRVVKHLKFSGVKGPSDILWFTKEDMNNHLPPIQYEIPLEKSNTNASKHKQGKENRQRRGKETEIKSFKNVRKPVDNGRLANGRISAGVSSSTQTDDESSLLTDDVAPPGVSARNKTFVNLNGGLPQRLRPPPLRMRSVVDKEGYFSESDTYSADRHGLIDRKMYSSTGDLWRSASGAENDHPSMAGGGAKRRRNRIYQTRSASMNHMDRIRHYGTTLLAAGQLDRDFGFYGDTDKPATFHRKFLMPRTGDGRSRQFSGASDEFRRHNLYRKLADPGSSRYHTIQVVRDTRSNDLTDGARTAAIIKLRNTKPETYNVTTIESERSDVTALSLERSSSCSYDTSRSRASPTLSIPLGDTRDIHINTLTRRNTATWRAVIDDRSPTGYPGVVLSSGDPLVEPEKDEELLHIEIQGAEKEWTLKQRRAPKSPGQHSTTSDVFVQTEEEELLDVRPEVSYVRHGARVVGSGLAQKKSDDRHIQNNLDDVDTYHGNVIIPNPSIERRGREPRSPEIRKKRTRAVIENNDLINSYNDDYSQRRHHQEHTAVIREARLPKHEKRNVNRKTTHKREESERSVHRVIPNTNTNEHYISNKNILKIDHTIDKRSHLLSDVGFRTARYDSSAALKSPGLGSSHISRRFIYQPVQQRYRNRNHYFSEQGWNLLSSGRYAYYSGSMDPQIVDDDGYVKEQESTGLEKFPDFIYDGGLLRDVHISYNEDSCDGRTSGTLTPTGSRKLGGSGSMGEESDGDNPFSMEGINATKHVESSMRGDHVKVINVGDQEMTREDDIAKDKGVFSEFVVFRDSTGALYDTSVESLIASTRDQATNEIERITNSNENLVIEETTEITSETRVTKQDANNNTTSYDGTNTELNTARVSRDSRDSRDTDSASSLSSSVSGEQFGSYELAEGTLAAHEADDAKEHVSQPNDLTSSYEMTTESVTSAKRVSGTNLQPGEVTLKSTEMARDPSREIRNAVARANSTAASDQKTEFNNELEAVLRLRSVGVEGEDKQSPDVDYSWQTSKTSSASYVSETGEKLGDGEGWRQRIDGSMTTEGAAGRDGEARSTSHVMSDSSTAAVSQTSLISESVASLNTGISDPVRERVAQELVRSGSVSSLRQVYKTPPSSLRVKKTLSVAKTSDVFANSFSTNDKMAPGSDPSGGSGRFVMRFKEGDGVPDSRQDSYAATGSVASGSRYDMSHDLSLPASEEMHFHHTGHLLEDERVSIAHSDDALSQSSYSSSKLEHFNFGLSNFQTNF